MYTPRTGIIGVQMLRVALRNAGKEVCLKASTTENSILSCLKLARNGFSSYIFKGRYSHSLSLDATIMVSKNCPTIDKHVFTIFVTQ